MGSTVGNVTEATDVQLKQLREIRINKQTMPPETAYIEAMTHLGSAICFELAALRMELSELRSAMPEGGRNGSLFARPV